MDRTELARIAEAILFAAGDPVPAERLAFAAQCDVDEVNDVLRELSDSWAFDRRGIRVVRLGESWQLCSASDLSSYVTRALETRRPPRLSAAQLEALTVIAYYQPTTKVYVDQIRGVDSSYSVSALVNKHLIEESGRLNAPGRPVLYRTTPDFLRVFGLESLDELPDRDELQLPLVKDPDQLSILPGETAQ